MRVRTATSSLDMPGSWFDGDTIVKQFDQQGLHLGQGGRLVKVFPGINVQDFWEVGDTDWGAAINRAIVAGAGRTIVFPDGVYTTSLPHTISSLRTHMRGYGTAEIRCTHTGVGLTIDAPLGDVHIEGIRLSTTAAGSTAILINSSDRVVLRDVVVIPFTGGSWTTGVSVISTEKCLFSNVQVYCDQGNSIVTGLAFDNTSTANVMVDCEVVGGNATERGVYVLGAGRLKTIGLVVQRKFTVAAIHVDGNATNPDVVMVGPHVEVTSGGGVGYLYDNTGTSGTFCLLNPHQGSLSAAPSNATRGLFVYGGTLGAITLGAGLTQSLIVCAHAGAVTNGSATIVVTDAKPLSLGTADSGGAGFKLLRVPN